MKVRILVPISGDAFSWAAGDVVDVDDALATALCAEPGDAPRAETLESSAPAAGRSVRVAKQRETRATGGAV